MTKLRFPASAAVCLAAVLSLVAVVHAQPVPDTILLPDSLGPLRPGYHLAFGSSTDNIYVASESSDIIVVDGETFQRIKRINTGTPVGGALLVSQHNRLYCSYPQQGRIGVIDCATNSLVRTIEVGTRPKLLCYSTGSDKLYCGDAIDSTVSVINCATNAVVRVIPVGDSLTAMTYDPTTNKVYAATADAVLAISSATDSVVASIGATRAARRLCVNQRLQKLYVVGPQCSGPDTVFVVSTPVDSVIARMWWPYGGDLLPRLACNEATDRLYGVSGYVGSWYILEFDCAGDSYTRYTGVDGEFSTALVCDTGRNRLYYLLEDSDWGLLYGFDCVTLEIFSGTRVEDHPGVLELDPARARVLCAGGRSEAMLSVFDCDRDTLRDTAATPLSGWQLWGGLVRNSVSSRLYYRWGDGSGGVGVIDERTNRVVRHVVLPQEHGGLPMAYSPTSNKLYCVLSSGLAVLDGRSDSLLKLIKLGDYVPDICWCPDGNKLYCYVKVISGLRLYIAVLDCYTDSVVDEIEIEDRILINKLEYLDNGRLLCVRRQNLRLIDCRTDSVVADTALDGNVYSVAHTGDGKKAYILRFGHLAVLDASTLSLLTTVDWPYSCGSSVMSVVVSDSTHKLYWFEPDRFVTDQDSILVIDTRSDAVVARMSAGFRQEFACLDRSGRFLFTASYWDSTVHVYDTQSDSLAAVYSHLPGPLVVTPNPEQGCIYLWCSDVILVYPDAPPGVEETPNGEVRATKDGPTVVRGVLVLDELGTRSELPGRNSVMSRAVLLDASGRKVLDLHPGANDVRALAPGVYFVREAQAQAQARAVRKVIKLR